MEKSPYLPVKSNVSNDGFRLMELEKKFLSDFLADLNANRVVLPTLPEVVMPARKPVDRTGHRDQDRKDHQFRSRLVDQAA